MLRLLAWLLGKSSSPPSGISSVPRPKISLGELHSRAKQRGTDPRPARSRAMDMFTIPFAQAIVQAKHEQKTTPEHPVAKAFSEAIDQEVRRVNARKCLRS